MKVLKLTLLIALAGIVLPMGVQAAGTPESDAAARDQRVQAYAASYPVKLTDKEKTQIAAVCVSTQEKLQKIYDRTAKVVASRTKTYSLVDDRLDAVRQRLSGHQQSTSELDALLTNYRKQTTAFDSALTTYRQVLQDAATIDCKTNPVQFRSSVEAVRVGRKQVADDSASITKTTTDDLKTSFDAIKEQLSKGSK